MRQGREAGGHAVREGRGAGSRCGRKWQRQRQRQRQRQLRLHHSRHKVRRGAHSSRRGWHRRRCVWHPLVASRQEGRMWLHHRLVRVPRLHSRRILHRMPRLIRSPHKHLAARRLRRRHLCSCDASSCKPEVLRGLRARGHGRLSGRGAATRACDAGAEGRAARVGRGRRASICSDRGLAGFAWAEGDFGCD